MSKIFLIAGLGADTRLYNNIDLHEHDVTCVDWIEPSQYDTLETYAQKLIYHYKIPPKAIVIGTSMGGMVGIEIGKLIPLNKIILISSIKTVKEAPAYFNIFRFLPLHRAISGRLFTRAGFLIKSWLGRMTKDEEWLFNDMLKKSSPLFLKWGLHAVLNWKNEVIPSNVYHIMGDKDAIFSYKKIKNAKIIKGGTHIMVFNKAKEINKLLKTILKK